MPAPVQEGFPWEPQAGQHRTITCQTTFGVQVGFVFPKNYQEKSPPFFSAFPPYPKLQP